MNILVIGAGAWGTTIANLLSEKSENNVKLWCYEKELSNHINEHNENIFYMKGKSLNKNLKAVNDLSISSSQDLIVVAVPSSFFIATMNELKKYVKKSDFLILTKGFELSTGRLLSDIMQEKFVESTISVLSGPNLATEIANKKPASAVIASENKEFREKMQSVFFRDYFRIYVSDDVIGVQIGGAFKNIIAIGAGISDALGFGVNTKAAYLTRGIMEMTRFGIELGAKPYTFSGLTGVGDLIATANSPLSRNYSFGNEIVNSNKDPKILFNTQKKAIEGVLACKAVYEKSKKLNIEVPITEMVYRIIYESFNPLEAVNELMHREPKAEIY
ncbi:MAG: NAD(P)-dependent glycerol-3-phosphate dehydrogenase [Candidatus Muirbacterium halophilum]|nr:NAD(P)-dependent glycerol-3-phosphate dehydrogenase [Candidatus Muirbacterium halophilum]MCK9475435.1 NAD(P)-dependent glycerol-3-phosphate dehydrogenase [Candidatus Muirbacterium halophilum]